MRCLKKPKILIKQDNPYQVREYPVQIVSVYNTYDFKQEIDMPIEELMGIDNQVVIENIITSDEMNDLIDDFYRNHLVDVRKIK